MFLADKNHYSPLNNNFHSSNTDNNTYKEISKSVIFIEQIQLPIPNFPNITRSPVGEN